MYTCEIGVGDHKIINESIGVDIRKTKNTDIIADARHLPFKDSCFDKVFSSHIIEHFSHEEIEPILREWIRILKKEGVFELRCPDLRARALLYFFNPSITNVKNIYGKQDYPENYHKCGFSYRLLKEILIKCGIKKIKRVMDGYRGIPFIPNDLHIFGIKK